MTDEQVAWVRALVVQGRMYWFYVSSAWKRVRLDVLDDYKGECQPCKSRGKYSRATVVHHWFHLDEYPQYALERVVVIDEVEHINLDAFCRDCHEEEHEHRHDVKEPLTPERW